MQPEGEIRRKRRSHHDDHEEHTAHAAHDESNWLVSYADMMTLLFGFFVLMYSFTRFDKEKFDVVSKDVVKYFGGEMKEPGAPEGMKKLVQDVTSSVKSAFEQTSEFEVKREGDVVILTLASDLLFPSGSARPNDQAMVAINKIYESLKSQNVRLIEVEGHTDGDPISTPLFPSNWELSTARASAIVRVFENLKVPPDRLKAAGFADSRPVVPEKNEKGEPIKENKNKNRRVVLNLKVDPTNTELHKTLEAQGLQLKRPAQDPAMKPDAPGATVPSGEMQTLQSKYEAMNQKLQEAANRLAEAQQREKKAKELEALAKKTEEMERKLRETEKKTLETMEKAKEKMGIDEKPRTSETKQ